MKEKNIYFVGYFLEVENKKKFMDAFDSEKKYVLENSISAAYNGENSIYFPSFLYRTEIKAKKRNIPKIDIDFKSLYRKDLKVFLGSKIVNTKSLRKNKLLFFRYAMHKYFTRYKGIHRLNILNVFLTFQNIREQIRNKNQYLVLNLRKYQFREQFINGYKYTEEIIEGIPFKNDDTFIIWGKMQSAYQLLCKKLEAKNIPYFFAEYGELPGTITLSKNGIFGELFTSSQWEEFEQMLLTQDDINYASDILKTIKEKQISTKSYGSNLYFLTKYFWEHSLHREERKKIIYVNGSELFISGFYNKRWGVDREGKHPNAMLLDKVVEYFGEEYMIIYKEHPMTVSSYPASLIDPSLFPTVHFVEDFNIHDLLDLADIVISFPSKVVITSLLYNVPTFVLGDFTIPTSIPEMNYYTSRNIKDIDLLLSTSKSSNEKIFVEFIARMIKYKLFLSDEVLFNRLDIDNEKSKIISIISKDPK